MKFTQLSLLAAAVATVNGAVVTVTKHVHQGTVVNVQGIVYVENGQTRTSYSLIDGATSTVEAVETTTSAAEVPVSEATTSVAAESQAAEVSTSVAAETASFAVAETASTAAAESQAAKTTTSEAPSSTRDTTTVAPTTTSSSSSSEATTSTATSPSSSANSDFASTVLDAHNKKRSLHKDTPSLSWSDELASYAQAYADKYDCSGTLTHSGGPYGENLALGYDASGSVDAWYNEIKDYDYSNPTFSSGTGHFTQVVWKSTTQVGCGIKKCNNSWGSYVICSYNPAGNFLGKFGDNVEPLK